MGILFTIIFGGLVGWVASLIMKTDGQQGVFLNIVVGIVGAVIGGWIMSLIGADTTTGFSIYGFLVALLGACVLLAVLKFVRR
ncbi:MAG: transglycosylase [Candidatus Andersenbacteria bacterium RIFCSPHIGHO2_12_FULL_45_11b]|uniref:Transglycosylase n=1 Tax=Candidatus Andersenbacteria bacterium RIFCSPHIGHO2_12_FULL_45_11b TaxID=1797282 RepID=A0A1G1XES1_9BACT|nr:MAG: transglycosylase [Candidatus Andersenbacteria bacterium RIFCSPHIGHO2_12_FULL_45_11b]